MTFLNRTHLTSNLTLKILSLIMGYTFWFVWSQTQLTYCCLTVPLCVYNLAENAQIEAPETVDVQLAGKLRDIYHLNLDAVAVHVDGATLQEGSNPYTLTSEQLFVPDTITMVHYAPSNVVISYHAS